MTIADSRVVLSEFFAGKRNSVGDYWPPCMAKEAHESLLAEAESAANNLHTNLIAAYAERDALQSRLDAVAALADKWEGVCTQMGGKGTSVTDSVITICVRQLRAALGCESRGDGEVGS